MTPDNQDTTQQPDGQQHVYVTPRNLRQFKSLLKKELRRHNGGADNPNAHPRRVITGRIPKIGAPHNGNLYEAFCRNDGELLLSAYTDGVKRFLKGETESCSIHVSVNSGEISDVFISPNPICPHTDDDSLLNPRNPYGLVAAIGSNQITLSANHNRHEPVPYGHAVFVVWTNDRFGRGDRYVVGWSDSGHIDIIPWSHDMARDALPKPDSTNVTALRNEDGSVTLKPSLPFVRVLLQVQRKKNSKRLNGSGLSLKRTYWGMRRKFSDSPIPARGVYRVRFVTAKTCDNGERQASNICGARSPWSVLSIGGDGTAVNIAWLG